MLYKVHLPFKKTLEITNHLLNENLLDLLHKDFINHYLTPGDFVNLINFAKENNIDLTQYDLNNFLLFITTK